MDKISVRTRHCICLPVELSHVAGATG